MVAIAIKTAKCSRNGYPNAAFYIQRHKRTTKQIFLERKRTPEKVFPVEINVDKCLPSKFSLFIAQVATLFAKIHRLYKHRYGKKLNLQIFLVKILSFTEKCTQFFFSFALFYAKLFCIAKKILGIS